MQLNNLLFDEQESQKFKRIQIKERAGSDDSRNGMLVGSFVKQVHKP